MSLGFAVEVPTTVLSAPLDDPWLDTTAQTSDGLPDSVALRWIDAEPFTEWSFALLGRIDPQRLPKQDLPTYISLSQRAESWLGARRSRATVAMAGLSDKGKRFKDVDTGAHELVAALRIPLGAAQTQVYRDRRMTTHLPGTQRLYDAGLLTPKHVAKIVAGTGHLDQAECAAVEERVLPTAEHLSVHEFARRVRRAVAKIHPRMAKERHQAEADQSDVTLEADDDAMSWISSRLPLVDGLIVKKAVDHYALSLKKAGDPRPIGVLRAEALRTFAEAYLTGQLTGGVPTHHGRPIEIGIVVTPDALLGCTDTPAEIPGVGTVPIEVVRAMLAEARLRILTIDTDNGRLLDRNTRWRIPRDVQAFADSAYVTSVGPYSTVPADRCDGEHIVRHPEGPSDITNIAPMDRGWHVPKTHAAGMLVKRRPDGTLVWTTPLGQTVLVHPYDYRLGP